MGASQGSDGQAAGYNYETNCTRGMDGSKDKPEAEWKERLTPQQYK